MTLLIVVCSSAPIFAISFGLYGKGGVSTSTYNYSPMAKTPNDHIVGFGLVLDTAVAKSKNFNYRLNLGYDNSVDSGMPLFMNQSMHRIASYHSFGLSPFANKYIRLWLGPSIGVHYQFAKKHFRHVWKFTDSFSTIVKDYYYVANFAIFDLGCLFGLNIHLADRVSFSAEFGTYVGAGVGTEKKIDKTYYVLRDLFNWQIMYFLPWRNVGSKKDVPFGKSETLIKMSILYRIGDVYDPTDSDIQKSYRFNKEMVKD